MSFASMREVLLGGGGAFTPKIFSGQEVSGLIREALHVCDKWHKRHCPLQAPIVLSTVLAMSLFRSSSIVNVFRRVLDAIRGRRGVRLDGVTPEALYKARARLGLEPLRHLALTLGRHSVPQRSFMGFIPCAIDGVSMNLPDTPGNDAEFGRPTASRGETAFPQIKGTALIYTETHSFIDCEWGRWNASELVGAERLLKHLDARHLVFLDRRYTKCDLWFSMLDRGVHFVHRLSGSYKPKITRCLGAGDYLVEVERHVRLPLEDGKRNCKRRRESRTLRMLEYQVGDNERVCLLTDLVEAKWYPARELAIGYHHRWEIENALDEGKTHLHGVLHGTLDTVFRSQTPTGIYQEAWAMLATYNLVRGLIAEAGTCYNIPPLEISFVDTLEVLRLALPQLQSCPPRLHKSIYQRMLCDIASCRLTRPRRCRSVPRVVKQKIGNFRLKKPHHKATTVDYRAEFRLVERNTA